jgi:hypothetical protein
MTNQKTTNNRFDALVQYIKNDTIQAVLVADETRLFRDAKTLQVNDFLCLYVARSVVVVTPQLVYDFHNPYYVRVFRFMCQQAFRALQDC